MYCMLDNKRMREGKKTNIYIFFLLIVHTHARMHARTHASLIAQLVKNPAAMQETPGSIPGSEGPLEGIGYPL